MLITFYQELQKDYEKALKPITQPLKEFFETHKDICYDGETFSLFGATAFALVCYSFTIKCLDVYTSADFQKWLKDTYYKKGC